MGKTLLLGDFSGDELKEMGIDLKISNPNSYEVEREIRKRLRKKRIIIPKEMRIGYFIRDGVIQKIRI